MLVGNFGKRYFLGGGVCVGNAAGGVKGMFTPVAGGIGGGGGLAGFSARLCMCLGDSSFPFRMDCPGSDALRFVAFCGGGRR